MGSNHQEILQSSLQATQGQTQNRNLNGLTATHFAGILQSKKSQPTQARLTLVNGPNNHTYILQYTTQSAQVLQANLARLQAVERSFRPMSSANAQAARPWTLQVVPMPVGGFEQLARESVLGSDA